MFYKNETWVKKTGLFDITMGAYMGAEVCDLVGLFLLSQIDEKFPLLKLGLYRDDGLGVTYNLPGPTRERMKKDIIQVFKSNGLNITIDMGPKKAEFLDVVLDLEAETYSPYRKPNSQPRYINVQSNHPRTVIEQVPKSINKRLSKISSNKTKFDSCKIEYENALKESGYKCTLNYEEGASKASEKNRQRKRRRTVTWYNPPYNAAVKTPIGRKFRNLVQKHFGENSPLKKIFNKNTLKLSYSCMKNMEAIIKGHNNKLMRKAHEGENQGKEKKSCNCRGGTDECPLAGKCLTEAIVYKAEIDGMEYIGSAGGTFKQRWYGHKRTFTNHDAGQTALSSYIRDRGLCYRNVKWTIHKKASPRPKGAKFCDVCLSEKLAISKTINRPECLNRRREFGCKCPHRYRHLLAAVKEGR